MLNLIFTHTGEWVKVPKYRDQKGGPDYHSYNVGRLEMYIDTDGITRSAVSYGDDADKLTVWFDYNKLLEGLGPHARKLRIFKILLKWTLR